MKPMLTILLTVFALTTTAYACISHPEEECNVRLNGIATFVGRFNGEVRFTYNPNSKTYLIRGTVRRFRGGTMHGVHIHNLGNLNQSCVSAGPHYNPNSQLHGGPTSTVRHAGDLGNFMVTRTGGLSILLTISESGLGGCNSIIGRALVIHAKMDDLGQGGDEESTRTGNAGARAACAVIGIDA